MPPVAPVLPEKMRDLDYPSSDGKPMGETPLHITAIILLLQALQDVFRNQPGVYLAADMFWYWEEGNPAARCAPDVMAVKGVGQKDRRSFFSWKEGGAVPTVVFEMASEGTWREDLFEKRKLYAELGVAEYFLFDPEALYLRPPLQGFRRSVQGVYVPLVPDGQDQLPSAELGLLLKAEGAFLRLIDPATGQAIPTREERVAQLQALLQEKPLAQ